MPPHESSLSTSDVEFRRAQEMALAVAALAPTMQSPRNRRRGQQQTAQDIRMAVADVLCAKAPRRKSKKKKKFSSADEKTTVEEEEEEDVNILQQLLGPSVEPYLKDNEFYKDHLESKILEGWNLASCLLVLNLCLIWQAWQTPQPISNFLHSAFCIHMTILYCLTTPKKSVTASTSVKEESSSLGAVVKKTEEQLQPIEPVSKIKSEWLDDISFQQGQLEELEQLQPTSTLAERRRFLKARKHVVKAASAQLGQYLEWRLANRIDEFFPSHTMNTDQEDWACAARGAMEIANTSGTHADIKQLPRLVSIFEGDLAEVVVCNNGARVVHVLPCQLDSTLASNSTYALAVAMYLDRKLDRECTEKVTVVIDIRSGEGWSNPSSVSVVPFIKLVVGLLNTYFPERLSRCILYPLPYTATLLFNKAKDYLDPDTAAKIQVCSGAGSAKSPIPEKVKEFIGPQAVMHMETRRTSFFHKK